MQDGYSYWIQGHPTKSENTAETASCLQRFMLLSRSLGESTLITACQELQWTHDAKTPHRPETNGVAERAVRRVEAGSGNSLPTKDGTARWQAFGTCGTCTTRLPMARQHQRKYVVETLTDQWSRSQPKSVTNPILPQMSHGCISLENTVLRVEEDGLRHSRFRRLGKPVHLQGPRQKIQAPRSLTGRNTIISMCGKVLSNSSIFHVVAVVKNPAEGTLSPDEEEKKKKQSSKKKTDNLEHER